jgi:hypothetical protein
MPTSDNAEGRRHRFWPRNFWLQLLLVVLILYVLANVVLLTATTSDSGSLGIIDTVGTGTSP